MLHKILPLGKGISYQLFLKEKIQDEEVQQVTGSRISEPKTEPTEEQTEQAEPAEEPQEEDQIDTLDENLQNILSQKMVGG